MSQSRTQRICLLLVLTAGLAALAEHCQAQSFQYPPYGAQRGRMVARSGLGHSVRYRWGNGLTPTGGAVITNAIDAFAPALIAVAGGSREFEFESRAREAEARSREADRARAQMRDRLAIAQEEANALLARTARLVDEDFAVTPSPDPKPGEKPSEGAPDFSGAEFGTNPWEGSSSGDSDSPGGGDVKPLGEMGTNPWDNPWGD